MWAVFLVDYALALGLARFGIQPRDLKGLLGIVLWPFLHGDRAHLVSNTVSFLALGAISALMTRRGDFLLLTLLITVYAGFGLWLLGREATHIGASGLVFGYFGYILARGIYDGRLSSVVIASLVMIGFGGMIWGVLPSDQPISWEGHLCGFISGALLGARSR